MTLVDEANRVVVERLEIARDHLARMQGLLGRHALAPGDGLYLAPCSAIHTVGMRFAIDLIFVDGGWRVVDVIRDVGPFRMVWGGWRARGVVEVGSGWLNAELVRPGSVLHLRELPPPGPAAPAAGSDARP
ncbi:MAG: DUF192 domain-containing protein [Lentisphaerae bacterium]|nr:DUF192 domain-containing protein [Lentisphaerota bacterium]